jgi:PPM family protein phosphatase
MSLARRLDESQAPETTERQHPALTAIRAAGTFTAKGARPAQEDAVVADSVKGIFAVADGFGGPVPGAEASRTACEAVREFLFREAGDLEATLPFVLRSYFSLAGNVLFNALVHANRKLMKLNGGKGVHERGGASLIAGFLDGDLLAIANVGACSASLFRGGCSRELVIPRTYGRLRDPFESAPEVAERAAPLIALGICEDLEPEIFEYRVQPGDWLLLHTDGAGWALRERILDLQLKSLSPQDAVEEALRLSSENSCDDNIAFSLVIF